MKVKPPPVFYFMNRESEPETVGPAEQLRNELLAALRKKEAETGKTLAEVLVDSAYSEDKQEQREALDIISDVLLTNTRYHA